MTVHEIHELWKAQPFRSFIIHVADGRSFPVPHPDFLFLAGGGRSIIVNSLTNESYNILDSILITSLEVPIQDVAANPESSQKLS